MRMDRYEEEENLVKPTRTNKNQELYTDVYLNNVFVDVENLQEVMQEDDVKLREAEKKSFKTEFIDYQYEEKDYDIQKKIQEVISESKEVPKKLMVNEKIDQELNQILETINANRLSDAKEDTLLTELMPDQDTTVIPPLEEPILDTSIYHTNLLKTEGEENFLDDDVVPLKKEMEMDTSFVLKKKSRKKIIFIILGIILFIILLLGILIWQKVIHF